ncbi:MAG: cobalt ECF transporter T component CbiQ [Lachnospiraceae bacterium]|nr:cobalt ECF transporter T component CbiQ [Lachnospiraceae bacterium]
MDKINRAALELREMDDLAARQSPVHSLHPLAKLVTTIAYILVTVSFGKYDLSGLLTMALYPIILFSVSGISMRTCFYKLRYVLPLVCAVGLFNPFFDKAPILYIGKLGASGGVISMITLMLKGVLCLQASFLLAATTQMDALCAALRKIRVPGMLVTMLLLTYRYISVMVDEVSVMTTAYKLRAPGQKGIHISAWGSFLGQLLLRSMDRADELYVSMQLRGFAGEFQYADVKRAEVRDWLFAILLPAAFILLRYCNVAELLGQLLSRGTGAI